MTALGELRVGHGDTLEDDVGLSERVELRFKLGLLRAQSLKAFILARFDLTVDLTALFEHVLKGLPAALGKLGVLFVEGFAAFLAVLHALIDLFTDSVGHGGHGLFKLVDSAQALRQLEHVPERDDRIGNEHCGEEDHEPETELLGDGTDEPEDHRVNNIDDEHAGRAPDEREFKTDIAFDIERIFGIVPPLVMEELLHDKANEELQRRGEHHTAEKQQRKIILDGLEHQQHYQHTEAVYRTDGAVEKAAVDKDAAAHRRKGDLAAPAEKRIYKNYPYHLTKAVTNIHDEPPV